MENETNTDNVIEASPKSRLSRKRERQSLTPDSATRAQTNENWCQDTLDKLNSKIDKLQPILGQISKLQENVEQLLKENAELKKAIEFNNCEIEDLKKETKTLCEKHAEMASFAATTGVKVVKLESQLIKAETRNIKLEAYTVQEDPT